MSDNRNKAQDLIDFSKIFFLSHVQIPHGDVAQCLAEEIIQRGFVPWYDNHQINPNLVAMQQGVDRCTVFVVFVSPKYPKSRYCCHEFRRAVVMEKPIVYLFDPSQIDEFSTFLSILYEKILQEETERNNREIILKSQKLQNLTMIPLCNRQDLAKREIMVQGILNVGACSGSGIPEILKRNFASTELKVLIVCDYKGIPQSELFEILFMIRGVNARIFEPGLDLNSLTNLKGVIFFVTRSSLMDENIASLLSNLQRISKPIICVYEADILKDGVVFPDREDFKQLEQEIACLGPNFKPIEQQIKDTWIIFPANCRRKESLYAKVKEIALKLEIVIDDERQLTLIHILDTKMKIDIVIDNQNDNLRMRGLELIDSLGNEYQSWKVSLDDIIRIKQLNYPYPHRYETGLILAHDLRNGDPNIRPTLSLCRHLGRKFLIKLTADFKQVCSDYMKNQGYAEALNVLLVTAPLDAANSSVNPTDKEFPRNWSEVLQANYEIEDRCFLDIYNHILDTDPTLVEKWYPKNDVKWLREELLQFLKSRS